MIGIIDDSLVMALELKKLFSESFPHDTVETFNSSEEFLVKYSDLEEKISFLSIDYNLPGKNGMELAEALRAYSIQVPMLLLTANSQNTLADRCKELNVFFMRKPLDRASDYERFIDEMTDFVISLEV